MVKSTVASRQDSACSVPLSLRDRMVVEHENGRIEDLGLVDLCVLDRGVAGRQFQWHCPDAERDGAARVSQEDFDANGLRRPLEVKMRSGERQYWYVGAHARARLSAFRYNQRLLTRQAAER